MRGQGELAESLAQGPSFAILKREKMGLLRASYGEYQGYSGEGPA